MRDSKIITGAKTREELARDYRISRRTLYNWLKRAGIRSKGKLLTPLELQQIYTEFGLPEVLQADESSVRKLE
jgi:transposase-like protein